MCGLAGFLYSNGKSAPMDMDTVVRRMAGALQHRGPDDAGTWVDADSGIAFGHRRLAVIDLSPRGRQPMESACRRFVIVFNGEIYNFRSLRQELERAGYSFRSDSDTEVILAAITEWGLETSLSRLNGMFAFALWNRNDRTLVLARDRLGEKPLYYGWLNDVFVFASELKALRLHPSFVNDVDRNVLALYFRYNYVPAPFSIYRGVYKLPAGCFLTLPLSAVRDNTGFSPFPEDKSLRRPVRYWSLKEVTELGQTKGFRGSESDAVQQFESLLTDAVKLRMVADVPVGSFLSGGIDSSAVVSLMQANSTRPVKTFSIGSYDEEFDEARHSKKIAQHLGTDHTELYVSADEAVSVIPRMPLIYDEPFADSSQIAVLLVSQIARQNVAVSLSGDGGDELFAGYNLYFWARNIWSYARFIPRGLRRALARSLTLLPAPAWDKVFAGIKPLLPAQVTPAEPGDKLHRLAELLSARTPNDLYYLLMSRWRDPASVVIDSREPPTIPITMNAEVEIADYVQRMMYFDLMSYLPDDILVKVDRASMAVALEVRIPLLDHRIVEFASQLPLSMKVRAGTRKWMLRKVLRRYLPEHLIDRPKMGFSVPIGAWLCGPLREWAEELISHGRLQDGGYLNPRIVRRKWDEYLSGRRNWQRELWEVLMFQSWLEHSRQTVHA